MQILNQEQRELLLFEHKNIEYQKLPVVITQKFSDAGFFYFKISFELAIENRQIIGLSRKFSDIILEYKQWVDSIDINNMVTSKQQLNLTFKMKRSRKINKYLIQLLKQQYNIKSIKKLLSINPMIEYHYKNYEKLHNNYVESVKNYFLPNFLDDLNVYFF